MPILYRGAAVGTHWHANNARINGFAPRSPNTAPSQNTLMLHIFGTTTYSPYISLTWSIGVAHDYATMPGPGGHPTSTNPGYIYILDIPDDETQLQGFRLFDPVIEVSRLLPQPPSSVSYHHNGSQGYLLGLVNNQQFGHFLNSYSLLGNGITARQGNTNSPHLGVLVNALRDSEILALGHIQSSYIIDRVPTF